MLVDRRTKIVATIGPSTRSPENLHKAVLAGMNVARLNFSHGYHEEHLEVIRTLRQLSKDHQVPITILQDLQGPKIRVGRFTGGGIQLTPGEVVTITMKQVEGRPGLIPSDFPELAQSVVLGSKILMDDGLMELRVLALENDEIKAEVIYGGFLKDRKGVNCPGISLAVDALTPKDLVDLEFGLANDVDYVALSFVRYPKDIRRVREIIEARGSRAKICAKIEMIEAVDNLEEIIRLSDAVMVARGDLAVEIGQVRLPEMQKRIIRLCNEMNRPVITATQMLDSMVENPRPTRAEITDVANAVLDGSDALMLSAESASGKYPFKCIRTMHDIIREVERGEQYYKISLDKEYLSIGASIGASASLSALKINAKVIVCLTTTGKTAQVIAGFRPRARLIAVTDEITVLNGLELTWGLQTLVIDEYKSIEDVIAKIQRLLIENGLAKTGDKVILTWGYPMASGSKTNSIHIMTLTDSTSTRRPDNEIPLRCRAETEF